MSCSCVFLDTLMLFLWFALRKWKAGQPDNWTHGHEDGEDCAGLIHDANWNDFYCTDRIGFICEGASSCQYLVVMCILTRVQITYLETNEFVRCACLMPGKCSSNKYYVTLIYQPVGALLMYFIFFFFSFQ